MALVEVGNCSAKVAGSGPSIEAISAEKSICASIILKKLVELINQYIGNAKIMRQLLLIIAKRFLPITSDNFPIIGLHIISSIIPRFDRYKEV